VIGRALIAQPRVRLARDLGGELSGETRLADAGLAREQDDLAGAAPGLVQAVVQQGALGRPPDEVGDPAARRLEPALRHGDALDREGLDRLGEALRCLAAEIGEPEEVADEAASGAGEDDLTRLRQSLQARREVGRVAGDIVLYNLAAHDNQPGGNPHARLELFDLIQLRHPIDQRQSAARGTLGVVLMRPRIAEIGQHPVAHVAGDKPAKALDDLCDAAMVSADNPAQIFGIEPRRQRGRADEIAEHHRQLPPLGSVVRPRTGRYGWRRQCLGGGQTGNGSEETLAVPERHAKLLEIDLRQLRQDIGVDVTRTKQRLVLSEAKTSEPTPDIHGRAPPTRADHPSVEAPCPGLEINWLDGRGKQTLT